MDCVDALYQLEEHCPDVFLGEVSTFFLLAEYLFQKISSVSILHDDTRLRREVPKGMAVGVIKSLLV